MILAITIWNNRTAPVFDVAKQLLLVEIKNNKIINKQVVDLPEKFIINKVITLSELKVSTLICGAVSAQAARMLEVYNIQFYSFVSGEVDQILESWLTDHFHPEIFAMPGCRRHGCHGRNQGGRGRHGQAWNTNYRL